MGDQEVLKIWRSTPIGSPMTADELVIAFAHRLLAAQDCVSVPREPSTGIAVIAAERWRQIEQEFWTAEHDAEHDAGELAAAGAAYAINAADQLHPYSQGDGDNLQPQIWPWDSEWWKPKGALPDLVRAGALIAAEIDKLLAASEPKI